MPRPFRHKLKHQKKHFSNYHTNTNLLTATSITGQLFNLIKNLATHALFYQSKFFLYRIHVKTQSLDIVYNPEAVHWLTDFFTKPLLPATDSNLRTAARKKYQAIKTATKNELIKNWEQILAGDLVSLINR